MIGPVGARARPHPWWSPLRVLLGVAVLTGLLTAVVQVPCATGSDPRWLREPATGAVTLCASDLPGQYLRTGLAEGRLPVGPGDGRYEASGLTAPVAVLAAGTAGLARTLTGAGDVSARDDESRESLLASGQVRTEALAYTALTSLLMLLAAWVVVAVVARAALRERALAGRSGVPPVLWWLAASPVLVLAGLSGWEVLTVALGTVGFVAWRSGRAVVGGVLVGAAVASSGLAVAVLVALAAVAVRRGDREANAALAASIVTWLVLSASAFVLTAGASNVSVVDAVLGTPQPGTVWSVVTDLGLRVSPGQAGTVTALAWLAVLVAVVAVAQVPRWDPDPAVLVVLALVGLLVVGAGYDPAQSLWLLPFVVLALADRPAWELLPWQAAEVLALLTRAWDEAGVTDATDGSNPLAGIGVVARVAGELWLAWRVVDSARPTPPVDFRVSHQEPAHPGGWSGSRRDVGDGRGTAPAS